MAFEYFNTVSNPNTAPGYTQRAKIASISWFNAIAAHDTDSLVISAAHAFLAGLDFISCYGLPKSIIASSTAVGENGALSELWKPEIFMPGDGGALQQMLDVLKNDDLLFLIEDVVCAGSGKYVQFGDKLLPCHISNISFASGTVYGTEKKGYKLELIAASRYEYVGNVHRRFGQRFGMRFR